MSRPVIQGLCSLALLACALPASGAQNFPSFPVRDANAYSISARQDEVRIGLEPVEHVSDQLTYFHTALSPKGFLPVFVVIQNRSKVDSTLLDKTAISYGLDGSKETVPKVYTPGKTAAVASAEAIPYVVFFALEAFAKSSEIEQNLISQELQSNTLSPGETAHGFLYIRIPKKGPRPKIHIQIPLAWSESTRVSVVKMDF